MKPLANRGLAIAVLFAAALAPLGGALAQDQSIALPRIFASHMVLQRDMPLPVWGWADPGEQVTVEIAGKKVSTAAAAGGYAEGYWKVELPPMEAGGPYTMTISGKQTIELTDVLVGEVWICSGQSNMERSLGRQRQGGEELPKANYPKIRFFEIDHEHSGEPIPDVGEHYTWCACTSSTAYSFSAAGYYFGRDVHKEVGVPVGLISTNVGGTRIEPWTPPEGFQMISSLQGVVREIEEANQKFRGATKDAVGDVDAWVKSAKTALAQDAPLPPLPELPRHELMGTTRDSQPNRPTSLYNAMVYPIVPYGIRGVIWYQGEQNVGEGMFYFEKMKALVGGWRKVWGQGDFPFYFTQLSPFHYEPDYVDGILRPGPLDLPQLWEAQTASLSIPNTGMAVTADVGDPRDIHPNNKLYVGTRLARWALAKTYGRKDLVYSGPLYRESAVEGSAIRISFDYVGSGLVAENDEPLGWFEIAGADRKFVPAEAKIDDETVVVSCADVSKPAAVRYAFHERADVTLFNKEGLPASPFRTDSWPIPPSPRLQRRR